MKKVKRNDLKLLFIAFCVCFCGIFMTVGSFPSLAANTKSEAMKAYKRMLKKSTLRSSDWGYGQNGLPKLNSSKANFAICYINNDKIPELIIESFEVTHVAAYGRVYTYHKGKVCCVGYINTDAGVKIFKKTGCICGTYGTGGIDYTYFWFDGKKLESRISHFTRGILDANFKDTYSVYSGVKWVQITKKSFNSKLKFLTKGKSATKVKFYKNTKSNRAKILK